MGQRGHDFVNGLATERTILALPGVNMRLTAEHALRAAIDNQVFASLRDLESLDGGRAVQVVYVALIRRLPNVVPDRKRLAIDTGFSESSVKRAISLLERSKLVRVERSKGHSSTYVLADIRATEVASECVAAIKRLARDFAAEREVEGQATSEPTECGSRVTSEPSRRVSSELRPGPLLTHKEAIKIQPKQQDAAAGLLERTLKRWGLESASYLAVSGHPKAIPELAQAPEFAARVIDAAMRKGSWSASAGVGSKVAFLRQQVPELIKNKNKTERNRQGTLRDTSPPNECSAEDDLRWRAAEATVASMSETEFCDACERLFAERPSLRKLYGAPIRERRGLHYLLVQAVVESLGHVSVSSATRAGEPGSPRSPAAPFVPSFPSHK